MTTNTHNALHIKKKIQPLDYKPDANCVFINVKTGARVNIPSILVVALREGKVELIT